MSLEMRGSGFLRKGTKFATTLGAFGVLALAVAGAQADDLVDESVRARMLQHKDGRVARIQSEYHDVFVEKRGPMLALTTWARGETYFQSIVDLRDPDALLAPYTRIMNAALLYPQNLRHVLMIGLGAGSVSTYLGHAMPELRIDAVELDPGVIAAGRKYFGLKENGKVRFIESDGRVYLNRSKDLYDLIILDAFRDLGVPFHLLTREFYTLVKARLAPGGAAAFNVHDGNKLYGSTVKTLGEVFGGLDLYSSGIGEVIAVGTPAPLPKETVERAAVTLQERHGFRFALPQLLGRRISDPRSQANGDIITDDFSPADVYDVIGKDWRKRE
jgi:spermidine synthase